MNSKNPYQSIDMIIEGLDDCIENFNETRDLVIEHQTGVAEGFFEGYRFMLEYYDLALIKTKEQLGKFNNYNLRYPDLDDKLDLMDEKMNILTKMLELHEEWISTDEVMQKKK